MLPESSEPNLNVKCYEINHEALYHDLMLFADYVRLTYKEKPRLFGVPRGGLIIAGHLAHILDIKEILACPVSLMPLMRNLMKPTDLIVEDIYDSGKTYREIREYVWPEVRVVSLYCKRDYPEDCEGQSQFIRSLDVAPDTFVLFPWEKMAYEYYEKFKHNRFVQGWWAQS